MSSYTLCNTIFTNFPYKYLSNLHHLHTIISDYLLLLPSTTTCFHRWPFIKRGNFGNSGIVWTVNGNGGVLQRSTICLDVKLICLDARLTIKVSFALERTLTLPQPPIPHHPFLLPPSPPAFLSISLHYCFSLGFLID